MPLTNRNVLLQRVTSTLFLELLQCLLFLKINHKTKNNQYLKEVCFGVAKSAPLKYLRLFFKISVSKTETAPQSLSHLPVSLPQRHLARFLSQPTSKSSAIPGSALLPRLQTLVTTFAPTTLVQATVNQKRGPGGVLRKVISQNGLIANFLTGQSKVGGHAPGMQFFNERFLFALNQPCPLFQCT